MENENKRIKSKEKYIKPSVLGNIKSKYNLNNIFDFVRDSAFKYKIFVHSKSFQEKLDLNLTKYRAKYLERFKLNPKKFLSFDDFDSNISLGGQNIIKKGLSECLSKKNVDIKIYQEFVKEYFMDYFKRNDDYFYIDIFSPFFDLFSTSEEIFERMLIILKIFEIKKYSLEHHYISIFENLKKMNINKYSLSICLSFKEELKFLDELKIDFNNLKRLELIFSDNINIINTNSLQKVLFSNKQLKNNLLYLHLVCSGEKIEHSLFQNINDFYLLTELNLERCKFDEIVVLELPNLTKLNISFCDNISLSNNTCLKIKKLLFQEFILKQLSGLYKFPKLEEFRCQIETLYIVDMSSLKNLNRLEINSKSEVILCDIQKKIPTLSSLDIKIKGRNNNSKIFEITENDESKIKYFSLVLDNCFPKVNCYINKFGNLHSFKFNINNINNINKNYLDEFDIFFHNNNNIREEYVFEPQLYFPFFKKICSTVFNYLRIFEFSTIKNYYDYACIPSEDLNNFLGNLNQMTNLKSFTFKTVSKKIDEDFHKEFIKSLLLLNISEIELDLMVDSNKYRSDAKDYTEEELKILYPSINFLKIKKIVIKKLHD